MDSVIIVHGGAGNWDRKRDRLKLALADCAIAAKSGMQVLESGGSSLDAVEAAVRILEDSPLFDAGRGSYLKTAGQIEMDALIMDGANLDLGAIAAVQLIRNPISLARRVMTESDHSFLVGPGAEAFADLIGFPRCHFDELFTEQPAELSPVDVIGDTVGAVALDRNGNLAAATSTGGKPNKQAGRVGDSPLVGSGAYADNWNAAASATGDGEALMKVVISKRVCDYVANGLSAQKACEAAITVLTERVNGQGGLIAIDARGRVGLAFNTMAMPHAYVVGDGDVITGS